MTHDEKMQSTPPDDGQQNHEKLALLNSRLADLTAQLGDAGVAVDRSPAAINRHFDRLRADTGLRTLHPELANDSVVNTVITNAASGSASKGGDGAAFGG